MITKQNAQLQSFKVTLTGVGVKMDFGPVEIHLRDCL